MSGRATFLRLSLAAGALLMPYTLDAAANVVLFNADPAGSGFNDPTPVAPVGGNAGTTLGQQRLNAFQAALNIWGATLTSSIDIVVYSTFEPLSCNATSAVLGSAGPISVFRDFTGAPVAGHWYHNALANKLAGSDLSTGDPSPLNNAEIRARFNSNLGTTGCLTGVPFYLGLDNNHGAAIDLIAVVLHEVGHGLGFSTTTSGTSGNFLASFPSIYDHYALDTSTNKLWDQMTPGERVASAINTGNLVWSGANVTGSATSVLQNGAPVMNVASPGSVAGVYEVGPALFGPPLTPAGVTGELMQVVDQANGTGLACSPLSGANALAVNNNIALIDRGTCGFTVKVANAQAAGAKAVVIADNAAGSPPASLGGTDPSITIPSVRITQADGNLLKQALRFRSRTRSGVSLTLLLDLSRLAGADPTGRVRLFAPNPFQSGSSVSHWDTTATPNLLMEPAINGDLTHSVIVPQDLTFRQLQDIGW
ncbi:MAG: PA domain-containing protein [Bryobacteraceae bacterium]